MAMQLREIKRRAKDAIHPFPFQLRPTHCRVGVPGSPQLCALAVAARAADKTIVAVHMLRTISYTEHHNGSCRRYQYDRTCLGFVDLTDRAGSRGKKLIVPVTIDIELMPPKASISQKWLRSPERKKIVARSYKARKGKMRRTYRYSKAAILAGVRHGAGALM